MKRATLPFFMVTFLLTSFEANQAYGAGNLGGGGSASIRSKSASVSDTTFGGLVGYDGLFNRLEPRDPKTINHSLSLGIELKMTSWSLGASTGVGTTTNGENTWVPERNEPFSDSSLEISTSNFLFGKHKASHQLSVQLPTSESSQYEGLRASLAYTNSLRFSLIKDHLFLSPNIGVRYFSQTYDYSPTTKRSNPITSVKTGASLLIPFGTYLSLKLSGTVSGTQRMDQEQSIRAFNSLALSAQYKSLSTSLGYSTKTPDSVSNLYAERVDIVDYDEYRQVIFWGLAWTY